MAGLVDEFLQSMGPEVTRQLAKNLGINKRTAKQLTPQIAPMILGGLKKQMVERGGPERVDHILNKYGSPDVLNDIAGLFRQKAQDANPDPALGGLLGDAGVQAANMLSQNFKLSPDVAMKIIPALAPLVLGFLTKKRDQDGLGTTGLASMLDQDGDGSILDDVAGFLMSGASGGSLGGLLGGLFGGRRRR